MLRIVWVTLLLLMIPEIAVAADFYIHFEKCKITVGYLVLSNESLKTIDGDGSLTSCTRNSQSVHCEFDFQGQGKGTHSSADYKVRIETPPLLIFTDENMSDYYVIDQVQHAATLITRVMEPKAAGAKVCQGMYMTESEFQNMNKSKQK